MEKDFIVTKSNKLICANYDLSLQEQKVILTLASMVQPQDAEFKEYEFKIKDFMKLLGVESKAKYTEIPKITKELMKKVFEIKEGKDIIQLAWLSSARYKTGQGTVILKFDSNLKPYMLELKEFYTSYKLENVLSLKSKYSIRIYEILKSNLYRKQITIELEELKNMVGANASYFKVYADFKSKVLIQAQKELKNLTDINFDFEEIKTGRKVTSIKFYIKANKKFEISNEFPVMITTAVDDEVSATLIELEEETPIKKIMDLMSKHNITALEAKKIWDSSQGNIDTITIVYEYIKNRSVDNIVAFMISMVKPGVYSDPKGTIAKQTSIFHNFEQRTYDYDKLERELLGWDQVDEVQ